MFFEAYHHLLQYPDPSLVASHRVVVELDEDLLLGRSGGGISICCKPYLFNVIVVALLTYDRMCAYTAIHRHQRSYKF